MLRFARNDIFPESQKNLFFWKTNTFAWLFVERVAVHVLDGMLGVVIGFTWGVLLPGLDLSHASLPALALTIAAARTPVGGGTLADIAPLLRAEVLIGLAYILAGYSLFRWFEFQAKKRGTLEVF